MESIRRQSIRSNISTGEMWPSSPSNIPISISPLSLVVEPEYGSDAARALFAETYRYWRSLPKDQRPKFYLYGLSLGAMNSERSAELFELLGDPIQGALWAGPPFGSTHWRALTDGRNPGSPAWLPRFRDGAFVRFMNQDGSTSASPGRHGDRCGSSICNMQATRSHSSPIRTSTRPPTGWRRRARPDVSPDLQWYPVVTMLQLGLDMAMAAAAPVGYGHDYAPQHYIDAWLQVTGIEDWSREIDIDRLKRSFEEIGTCCRVLSRTARPRTGPCPGALQGSLPADRQASGWTGAVHRRSARRW